MTTSPVSRRGFLIGTAALGAATALPSGSAGAAPSREHIDTTGPESELAALERPIYLLETAVPETFSVDGTGTLTISAEHGKVGGHSLRWEADAGGRYLPRSRRRTHALARPAHYQRTIAVRPSNPGLPGPDGGCGGP